MQTWFDEFKRWISQKMADVPSSNLKGIYEELVALWATIEDIHDRLFPTVPIIEEIIKEDVPDI